MRHENPIQILVVDDHGLFREGLKMILARESSFVVIGEAATGNEALVANAKLRPQLILLDINLPDINGDEVLKRIKRTMPDVKIIIVTMHAEDRYIREFIEMGADGYLVKNDAAQHVISTIKNVMQNKNFDERTTAAIKRTTSESSTEKNQLSSQEKEVLKLICMEISTKEIAEKLSVTIKTIEAHRKNLMVKTGSKNMAGLVKYAIKNNIIFDFDA